eukprot:TRINITY_DN2481_c0_g1_i7.p2 TRINITY_DN2481_c0_g1~~TRINITY_DN2481_c0_g1_i7.p2  ORF type:complete len:191 (+),score=46.05 TRINITY_DN2481_c0_g1_i7:149-721(+)
MAEAETLTVALEEGTLTLHSTAVVCNEATIKGAVTIGAGTVVHPSCSILAEAGPIEIGANNIIEEQVTIRNGGHPGGMSIGSENLFEVGCCVEAGRVGDANVFGAKSRASPGATVDSGCHVGPAVALEGDEQVGYEQAVRAPFNERTPIPGSVEVHMSTGGQQREILKKYLPQFHNLLGKQRQPARPPAR